MSAKQIRRLCSDFAAAEAGDCSREQGLAYRRWIEQFAVPVAELPAATQFGPHFSVEGIDVFMRWHVVGDAVYGYPVLPNATDSDLPRNKSLGYRIPTDELRNAPKVKMKVGPRGVDGFAV